MTKLRVLPVAGLQRIDEIDQHVGGIARRRSARAPVATIADACPTPRRASATLVVVEEALRLVVAVAGDEGRALLLGEGTVLDLLAIHCRC
jgi:hypothetical protein